MKNKLSHFLLGLSTLLLTCQMKATEIDSYLEEESFLVAQLSVANILQSNPEDLNSIVKWIKEIGSPLDQEPLQLISQIKGLKQVIEGLGIDKAYVLLSINDIQSDKGPIVLLTMLEGRDPAPTALLLSKMLAAELPLGIPSGPTPSSIELTKDKKGILLGTKGSVTRYLSVSPTERSDLYNPSQASVSSKKDEALSITFSLGKDGRRVIRELWPMLPKPFEKLTGEILADQIQSIVFNAQLEPNLMASLELATTSNETAGELVEMIESVRQLAIDQAIAKEMIDEKSTELLKEAVAIINDDKNVLIQVNNELQEKWIELASQPLQAARRSAIRNNQFNNVKQALLAMHNYYDVRDYFPAAICDEAGTPLLSWRVAILPYLEENELYGKFHLNEPWNSPHNLKLAKRVPAPYQDLNHPQMAELGMTTLQRPIYDGSLRRQKNSKLSSTPIEVNQEGNPKHYIKAGLQLRDIVDGTLNTIMAVQVAPEDAVIWTKPADWEVDLTNPKANLFRDHKEVAIAGFYDGHARALPQEINPALLKKLLTHDGEEVVNQSE